MIYPKNIMKNLHYLQTYIRLSLIKILFSNTCDCGYFLSFYNVFNNSINVVLMSILSYLEIMYE